MKTSIEVYKVLPDRGKIIILTSDAKLSAGLLHLYPGQALDKHNRPITEQIVQVAGSCIVKLFNGEKGEKLEREAVLREGDSLVIPANQFHMHTNPNNVDSISSWKFEGDITQVNQKIRDDNEKLL